MNSTKPVVGISFLSLLGVVFITLKLCGVIHWSWWLVLLPLYGPTAFLLIFAGLLIALSAALEPSKKKR